MNTPAPALDCVHCARTISKTASHHITDHGRVLCTRCLPTVAHATWWPHCPHDWHDTHDHLRHVCATRAAAHAAIHARTDNQKEHEEP